MFGSQIQPLSRYYDFILKKEEKRPIMSAFCHSWKFGSRHEKLDGIINRYIAWQRNSTFLAVSKQTFILALINNTYRSIINHRGIRLNLCIIPIILWKSVKLMKWIIFFPRKKNTKKWSFTETFCSFKNASFSGTNFQNKKRTLAKRSKTDKFYDWMFIFVLFSFQFHVLA